MPRTALLACLVVALAPLAFNGPAAADWNRAQRGEFTTDCVESCQENPNVHPTRRAECAAYCGCVMGEAEKFISEPEYTQLDQIARDGGEHPKLTRFRALFPVCNKRIFGQ